MPRRPGGPGRQQHDVDGDAIEGRVLFVDDDEIEPEVAENFRRVGVGVLTKVPTRRSPDEPVPERGCGLEPLTYAQRLFMLYRTTERCIARWWHWSPESVKRWLCRAPAGPRRAAPVDGGHR